MYVCVYLYNLEKVKYIVSQFYRGSNISAQVLFNLLNELGKRYKMRGLPSILSRLIISIIQEHEC